jgi:hypothetical protein
MCLKKILAHGPFGNPCPILFGNPQVNMNLKKASIGGGGQRRIEGKGMGMGMDKGKEKIVIDSFQR